MVAQGKFREDLYYRINVITINLPALRERKGDIPLLAEHFIQKHAGRMGRPPVKVSSAALEILMKSHWPGNVRELQNELERIVLLSGGEQVLHAGLFVRPGEGATIDAPSRRAPSCPRRRALHLCRPSPPHRGRSLHQRTGRHDVRRLYVCRTLLRPLQRPSSPPHRSLAPQRPLLLRRTPQQRIQLHLPRPFPKTLFLPTPTSPRT